MEGDSFAKDPSVCRYCSFPLNSHNHYIVVDQHETVSVTVNPTLAHIHVTGKFVFGPLAREDCRDIVADLETARKNGRCLRCVFNDYHHCLLPVNAEQKVH